MSGSGKDEKSIKIPFKYESTIEFSFTIQVNSVTEDIENKIEQMMLRERN